MIIFHIQALCESFVKCCFLASYMEKYSNSTSLDPVAFVAAQYLFTLNLYEDQQEWLH